MARYVDDKYYQRYDRTSLSLPTALIAIALLVLVGAVLLRSPQTNQSGGQAGVGGGPPTDIPRSSIEQPTSTPTPTPTVTPTRAPLLQDVTVTPSF